MAEDKDVFKYAHSLHSSANEDRRRVNFEKFLTSLDTYDTVHLNEKMIPYSDPLRKYRLLWLREDLDMIKCRMRNLYEQKDNIFLKDRMMWERCDTVGNVLRIEEECMRVGTTHLEHPGVRIYQYSTQDECQKLKDEHDVLKKQRLDLVPGMDLDFALSRLMQEERDKRPGLDRACT